MNKMEEILFETIQSYNEYIQKVSIGCQKIADDLRENRISEALNQIIDFTEGAKWLSEASVLFNKNDVAVDLKTGNIQEYLEEINQGLEIQDYVLIADIFEYEIKPFFEECNIVEVAELK